AEFTQISCFLQSSQAQSVLCPPTKGCIDSDWMCQNGICIPKGLRCNGENDCMDNSDEGDCGEKMGSKACNDGTECVLLSHVCDGEQDCRDGSDELGCETDAPSVLCPSTSTHICISQSQFCNGVKDCPDGFDEKSCLEKCVSRSKSLKYLSQMLFMLFKTIIIFTCSFAADFLCKDRRSCVSKILVCDGRSHCHDGSDEVNCASEGPQAPQKPKKMWLVFFQHEFEYLNILNPANYVALFYFFLIDAAEKAPSTSMKTEVMSLSPPLIPSVTQAPKKPACSSPSVLCPGSSLCIKLTQMCDGKRDCPDGSDEKCVKRCPSACKMTSNLLF
uniref:Uncharacterized protein n=1 Tax=Oryzias latipes TaxID=8090 RepID=A0A3B3HVD2_ORYLA